MLDSLERTRLKELLDFEGYIVVDEADNAIEAMLKCENKTPDILIIDLDLFRFDGISTIKYISEHRWAEVIIAIDSDWNTSIFKVDMYEIDAFVGRPINRRNLIPSLAMAQARKEREVKLQNEYEKVEKEFYDKRSMDYTKHILMQQNKMEEKEIMQYLERLSLENGKNITEIANMIYSVSCEGKDKPIR